MIVLSACHSAHDAVPRTRCVDIVVGMSDEVEDAAAALFAEKFYGALGDGHSVQAAFRASERAVKAADPGQEVRLQLDLREGVDPDEIDLFAA